MKVTANGTTFNFPDGTSRQDIEQAIEEHFAGATQAVGQAADTAKQNVADAATQLKDAATQGGITSALGAMPGAMHTVLASPAEKKAEALDHDLQVMASGQVNPTPDKLAGKYDAEYIDPSQASPFLTPEMIAQHNATVKKINDYESSFQNNPERQAQREMEQARPWYSAIGRGIGHAATELGAGTANLIDKYAPAVVSNMVQQANPLGYPAGMTPEQRMANRAQAMQEENNRYDITSGESPVMTLLGEQLPYAVGGEIESRALGAAGRSAAKAIAKGALGKAEQAAANIATRASTLADTGAAGAVKKAANATSNFITDEVAHQRNVNRIRTDTSRMVSELVKSPVIGATQGAMTYDSSAGEGALAGALGAVSGIRGPLKALNKVENVVDTNTRGILQDMHREGFKLTPGVLTGNKMMQAEEAGMRNSDALGAIVDNTIDRPNQRKITEMAGNAIGLDMKGQDSFSQTQLADHMQNLKNQYRELERGTKGKFSLDQYDDLNSMLKEAQPTAHRNTSVAAQQRYANLKDIFNDIKTVVQPTRDANNRFAKLEFDGAHYQRISQRINDEISSAIHNGDNTALAQLRRIKGHLDDSIEKGLGSTQAKEWRDLNERYAMTNMLMENGLTPSGRVNPSGITGAVMGKSEAARTLTGKGGRIQQFQKIARYNDVLNNVEGSDLSGLGKADIGADRSIGKLPFQYRLPMAAEALARYRLSRAPTLGISPTASMRVGQSLSQANEVDKAKNWAKEKVYNARNAIADLLAGKQ